MSLNKTSSIKTYVLLLPRNLVSQLVMLLSLGEEDMQRPLSEIIGTLSTGNTNYSIKNTEELKGGEISHYITKVYMIHDFINIKF